MTVKEQQKILDKKIRQNKVDYDLYRKNAEVTALSLGKLDKYEYLIDQDLGCTPDPVQKAKFEYSPLGQVFNKGLTTDERQEGLLKRLKNIEDKTDNQLDLIGDQGDRQLDLISDSYAGRTKSIGFNNEELAKLEKEIKDKEKEIRRNKRSKGKKDNDKAIFNYRATDDTPFYFSNDTKLLNFAEDFYQQDLSFDEVKEEQKEMLKKIK